MDFSGGVRTLGWLHIAMIDPRARPDEPKMTNMRYALGMIALVLLAFSAASVVSEPAKQPAKKEAPIINPAPTPEDWTNLGKLPDWSGVWNPNITDQNTEIKRNPTPWTPRAAKEMEKMTAEQNAGHPRLIFFDCLPEAHPSWMLIS